MLGVQDERAPALMMFNPSCVYYLTALMLVVNDLKCERILRVMHTYGGKSEQQILLQTSQALPSCLLLSFSTVSVHDPILP